MSINKTLVLSSLLLSSQVFAEYDFVGLTLTICSSLYKTQNNDFTLPVSYSEGFNSYSQSTGSDDYTFNNYNIMPYIGLSYNFKDTNLSLNADIAYYVNSSSNVDNIGGATGNYWMISGGQYPENDLFPNYVDSEYIKNKQYMLDTAISSSLDYFYDNGVSLKPRLGVAFLKVNNDYDYSINGRMVGVTSEDYTTTGKQNVNTDYVGPMIGLKIEYRLSDRFNVFADGEAQFLRANSSMSAYKYMSKSVNSQDENVSDSDYTSTQRYKAIVGIDFITNSLLRDYSPKITLYAGLDTIGYSATIVNPNRSGDEATHIEGRSSFNTVGGLMFTFPIN
jgi:hypothetical protein